jgi:signal transduction histidine kinase
MRCSEFLGCHATSPDGADALDEPRPPLTAGLLCGTRCPFEEVLGTGDAIVGREIGVRHRDGTTIPVAASVSRMPMPDGGAVGVLRDLRASRSLDEAKTSFMAAVSHELRTPLALIDGYTQSLLHLDPDAATARRHLDRIAGATERLKALVDDIIDVSQLETHALALRRSPVALDGLLRAIVAERAEEPGGRSVRLEVPRGLPRVDVDATRIRQVVGNLVQNAEKHAGSMAVIEIRARRLDAATVVMTITDDGRGIAAEDREHIFERFFRGGRAVDGQVPGSGLGLYLCRRIVEAHGGWIRLDATTRGTSVSVGLPVALTDAGPQGTTAGLS